MTNDFDILTVRRDLIALREKHGADTPIGHRCSNLIEQLGNLQGATGDERKHLEKFIGQSVAELARLSSGPAVNAEE
jgi:hypothetical protein